ncbi:hypothetical protein AALP_AAs63430U000100 [Arabis alpina]|uniref:SHSP domain-containing protein n=1 Tax=Arabis alpina TaxID=50452 RepID=A0A087G172_ARAAL|nr:hypothetical protein AALP_AAs63430U000100 [Arabis alpina]
MKKEEVKVEIEDDTVLKISGERHVEKEDKKDDTWHRVERSSGKFSRKFRLPENNVKMDQVKASMENGVLTVTVPKVETKKKTQVNFFGFGMAELANMTELKVLKLDRNKFSSFSVQGLINLRELEVLDLSSNLITDVEACDGFCEILVANMTELKLLNLMANRFNSSFSVQGLINLKKLEVLDLGYNLITDIEAGAGDGLKMTKLKTLDLSGNNFSNTAQLKELKVYKITSMLSKTFWSSCYSLRFLKLSNNQLQGSLGKGSIPDSISKLKDLETVAKPSYAIGGHMTYGKIFFWIRHCLESLDLSSNKLDGKIPTQLAGLDSLGYFNVSFNNLSGEILLNGHLLTFGEMSYIGNARLCGSPTKKSCNLVLETSASKHAKEEEEEGDDVIDMVCASKVALPATDFVGQPKEIFSIARNNNMFGIFHHSGETLAMANARVDWKEMAEAHVFKADLPGMKKEEVKLEIEDDTVLKISGERLENNVKASMENGVLTVTVPKAETTTKKKTQVNVSFIFTSVGSPVESIVFNPQWLLKDLLLQNNFNA